MITSLKQWEIKFNPRINLNHNRNSEKDVRPLQYFVVDLSKLWFVSL